MKLQQFFNFSLFLTFTILNLIFHQSSLATDNPYFDASMSAFNKQQMLSRNNLHQIVDMMPGGYLIIDTMEKKIQINHNKFRALSAQKTEELKDFFVGKFVKVSPVAQTQGLDLPLELYNPYCFSSNASQQVATNQCPIYIRE